MCEGQVGGDDPCCGRVRCGKHRFEEKCQDSSDVIVVIRWPLMMWRAQAEEKCQGQVEGEQPCCGHV